MRTLEPAQFTREVKPSEAEVEICTLELTFMRDLEPCMRDLEPSKRVLEPRLMESEAG